MEEKKETEVQEVLRNKKVIVRYILKEKGFITNPKHVLYGGLAENATITYTLPILSSTGAYKNALTKYEKEYLEDVMGLERDALSVYKVKDNFWDTFTVRLGKTDTILDLSKPNDYIKWKVLRANTDFVADSLETLENRPKESYRFVMFFEGDDDVKENEGISNVMLCYKELGKIEDDKDTMRVIISTIDGRPVSANSKVDFLRKRMNNVIQADPKLALKVMTDPLLSTKVLITKAVESGVISKRGDYYYLMSDGSPLCGNREDPTFSVAAKWLNLPKNQELKLSIEAKLKE